MHIVFRLYGVLRFDSTVAINVLINISSPKLNNQFFLFRGIELHEYASGLTSTPKTELFCSCKWRKFIGQNKIKISKLQNQNFKFLSQKIRCSSHNLRTINDQTNISAEKLWKLDTLAKLFQKWEVVLYLDTTNGQFTKIITY